MRSLDPAEKERLLEEVRACLDDWEEGAEEADDVEEAVDLTTLLAEMAALKSEVRLESRQFKSALEELRRFNQVLSEDNERLARDLARAREQADEAQRQTERTLLLGMLDLGDRLRAGVEAASKHKRSFWSRLAPRDGRFAQSLGEGLALTLQRLDELLAGHRVRAIDALGQAVDPHRMRVVGVESAADKPNGVVVREVRRGFTRDGEPLRAAEVIVNKRETQS